MSVPVHFSSLKLIAKSPLHFRHAEDNPREDNEDLPPWMRFGSLVDMLLLTDRRPVVFTGKVRRGKEWDAFVSEHPGDIYTASEARAAAVAVDTATRDVIATEYLGLRGLTRRTQVPMAWSTNGVARATRGIDVLRNRRLVDLKVTNCTQPDRFGWHARKMLWHAQLADYAEGCRQNDIDISGGVFLVGIEAKAPHPVTVLRLTDAALEDGTRFVASWIETYKACLACGHWPGYTQSVQDLDVDVMLTGGNGNDEEDD